MSFCAQIRSRCQWWWSRCSLVGQQQTSDKLGQRLGILAPGKFGYEEHVCWTLHNREYGVVVRIHNQIHLKIPKTFSICQIGTRVNARSFGNGKPLVSHQLSGCIGMDQVVDALMWNTDAFLLQRTRLCHISFQRINHYNMVCGAKIILFFVEPTDEYKIRLFFCRTLLLVFQTSAFVSVYCWFSSAYSLPFRQ